jgi:hypothetical protein
MAETIGPALPQMGPQLDETVAQLREALQEPRDESLLHSTALSSARLEPLLQSLDQLLPLLRLALQDQKRQHVLQEIDTDPAPANYQSAVADYFEQLSRDYENTPTPSATP